MSCTKLSVVREQWARHRRQKWASCCRVKDSREPSEAFSGEVDSSGSRVECSVDQGKTGWETREEATVVVKVREDGTWTR